MRIWRLVFSLLAAIGLACVSMTAPGETAPSTPEGIQTQIPAPSTDSSQGITQNTYYVRPDGGSPDQCTGQMDAAYPGSGTGQPCAWDHPFRALPPGEPPRLVGGDTLVIGMGSYRMGLGAPGAESCDADAAWECHMSPVPSGSDPLHPTRILGAGWESGCANSPELWGAERANWVLDLTGTSDAEIACLEITDHSECVEAHSGDLACERDQPPFGDWAPTGVYAADSANVWLHDLNIHGLAASGVWAGRLTDWTVENVRVAGNGWVGWDGDLYEDSSNSGTLTFRHWLVEWNGCGETYPGLEPAGCWGQDAGGYGDGVGTADTGGDWIIEDSAFLHNTSDGLDLLYHSLGGSVVLERVRAEGNAGNQVKVTGQLTVSNSVLVGNCAFFEGQPFTYWVDHCRALGSTLVVDFTGGEQINILNTSFYGQGDGLVGGGPREGFACDGTETLVVRNSLFHGDTDYFDDSDITFLFYQEECGSLRMDSDYNIVYQAKNLTCGQSEDYVISGPHDLCQDPLLMGPLSGVEYDMRLTSESPALDTGDNALCPLIDFLSLSRPMDGDGDGQAVCDLGAYEWRLAGNFCFLPYLARRQ
jgi:hypothetical protein